jgi:predicted P-loop ATPase/GTPase
MVASSKIDVSENIIEEFQKLYDLIWKDTFKRKNLICISSYIW